MRKWMCGLVLVLLTLSGWVSGCQSGGMDGGAPATATAMTTLSVVTQDVHDRVFAEAVVEPAHSVSLSVPMDGILVEVLLGEGDSVAEGSLMMRLDSADADIVVARAEAGLAQAEAQLSLARAGSRAEELAVLTAQLDIAEAAVAHARAARDGVMSGLMEADALDAQAQLLDAQLVYEQADSAHDDTMKCYDVPQPDGTEREICPTLGTIEEMSRAQMEAAYAALVATQSQLDMLVLGTAPQADAGQARVQVALADRDAVAAQLELALAGARREEVNLAEAGVAEAEAAVAQAHALLKLSRIEAPFDATITDLPVEVGDTLFQGAAVATLATLDRLQLRTIDLNELDIVGVVEGQPVFMTFDAVPNEWFQGSVGRVEPQGRSQFGEVIYDVIVVLDAPPDWIRWGMAAQVEIYTGAAEDLPLSLPHNDSQAVPGPRSLIVEAAVRPARSSALNFSASGEISEVLAKVGMAVRAGDILAVLDSDNQRLAVAAAEAALFRAQAALALAQSQPPAAEIAGAEANLTAAEAGLQQAVALRKQVSGGVAEAEAAGVQAQLDGFLAKRRQLEAALLWAEGDDDAERAQDVRDQLRATDMAISALEVRLGALPVAVAARLREADAGVLSASGYVSVAQAAFDLVLAGPTTESVAIVQADVRQAEVDLMAAEIALARTVLRAPVSGTITQVLVEVGDTVSQSRPVLVVADLAKLQVETTDLTELDVVHVHAGQVVRVTVDALPGESWSGHVLRIKQQNLSLGGDAVYPALIELDGAPPSLKWGMGAAVTFIEE